MTTIRDVAQEAGVHPSTVSRVFSGKAKISAATRERVLAAAAAEAQVSRIHVRAVSANVIVPQSRSFAVDRSRKVEITGVKAGVVIVEQLLVFVQMYSMQVAGARTMHDLRRQVFGFLHKQSLAFFDRHGHWLVAKHVEPGLQKILNDGITDPLGSARHQCYPAVELRHPTS